MYEMVRPTVILSDVSWVLVFPQDDQPQGELSSRAAAARQAGTYRAESLFYLNQALVDFLKNYTHSHQVAIFTAGRLHDEPAFRPKLDQVFKRYFLEEPTRPKSHSSAYSRIARELAVTPEEIVFFDDTEKNVQAARAAGCVGIQYHSNEQLMEELVKLLGT